MTEESRYLSFSGIRVHFRVAPPQAPLRSRMLLLCSPLITPFHWRKLLPELSESGCLAVMADLPGFGRSDCDAPQNPDVRANLIWGILDDVDRSMGTPMSLWHLAAHGVACGTILRMAVQYPDSVKSQIHLCPTFTLRQDRLRQGGVERWFDAHVSDPRRFRQMVEYYAGFPMDDYVVDRMRAPLTRPGEREAFAKLFQHCKTPPRSGAELCPTLSICGGRDPLMDAARKSQIEALLPDAESHRLSGAGHFPMETHSRALRDYFRGWLRYIDGEE